MLCCSSKGAVAADGADDGDKAAAEDVPQGAGSPKPPGSPNAPDSPKSLQLTGEGSPKSSKQPGSRGRSPLERLRSSKKLDTQERVYVHVDATRAPLTLKQQLALKFGEMKPQEPLTMEDQAAESAGLRYAMETRASPRHEAPGPLMPIGSNCPLGSKGVASPGSSRSRWLIWKAMGVDPWEPGGCGVESLPSVNPSRLYHFDFFFKAKNLVLSPDNASATIRSQSIGGWVISRQALKRHPMGRYVQILVEEVDTERWADGLGIGVALYPNNDERVLEQMSTFDGYAYELLDQSWLLGYDGRARFQGNARVIRRKELRSAGSPWPEKDPAMMWRPKDLKAGDVVGVLATKDSSLLLFVNNECRYYLRDCNMPWLRPLHAVFDLDGCTKSIHLLDCEQIPREVEKQLAQLREADPLKRQP